MRLLALALIIFALPLLAENPPLEELQKGRQLIYDCQFEKAEKHFYALKDRYPESLAPLACLAMSAVGEEMMEGLPASGKALSVMDEAATKAKAAVKVSESDLDCLEAAQIFMMKGMVLGLGDRTGEALAWLKRGVDCLSKVKGGQERKEADNLLCICSLAINATPWPMFLPVSWLLEPLPDSECLVRLEEALQKGSRLEPEIRYCLAWAYGRRGEKRLARRHLLEMRRLCPDSPFVLLALARNSLMQGDIRGAYGLATNLYAKCSPRGRLSGMAPDAAAAAGMACFHAGQSVAAETWLERSLKQGYAKPWLEALCQYYLGLCADYRGDRAEALKRYAKVHGMAGTSSILEARTEAREKENFKPTELK